MPGVRPGALLGHTPGLWTPPKAAASAAFSPATMTGIQGWYDFSTLAGADGSAIASISDLSGLGRTATQATGINQPLVKAGVNGINGLKVGLFDGVQTVLQTAAFAVSQPMTVYAVITNTTTGRYWSSADASLSVRAGWTLSTGAGNFAGVLLNGGHAGNGPLAVTSVFNGVSSLIRADGVQLVTGDAGAGNQSNGIAIGAAVNAQFFGGKIGELFWTNVASVDTAAELYLKNKWGTP